jgi:hypothetical protein
MRYGVDKTHVAYQTFGGETIVIDFTAGTYFSMQDSAAEVWQMLARSMPLDEIVQLYKTDNPEQAEEVESAIRNFASELAAANILSGDERHFESNPPQDVIHRAPFSTLIFEKFDDMSQLIMLDPVHDVTEEGWPHRNG